jgi:multidrug efflux pump subunit AcrA (membrane-fusion protein)
MAIAQDIIVTAAQQSGARQWATVARGAALLAQQAITARDWAHLQQAEDIINSPQGSGDLVIAAIFGGNGPDLGNRLLAALHAVGLTASDEAVKAAKAAVAANRRERAHAASQRQQAENAAHNIVRSQKRHELAAEKAEIVRSAGIAVGDLVEVSQSYKQCKLGRATLTASNNLVEVFNFTPFGESAMVRVTALSSKERLCIAQVEEIK